MMTAISVGFTSKSRHFKGISYPNLEIELGVIPNTGNNQPERSDFPSLIPGGDPFAYQNTLNVIVADVTHLDVPASLSTVTIYSQNSVRNGFLQGV